MEPADLQLRITSQVRDLYERRPYPPVGYFSPFFQRIQSEKTETLHYHSLFEKAWGVAPGVAVRPRILVAGCGTFEPVVVALANPGAQVVAVDLSARSLRLARWHARCRGVGGRIRFLEGDLLSLPAELGSFDLIISTGVLHHLPNPSAGLRALEARLAPRGLLRLMVYSRWGRALLYAAKELAAELGVGSPREFRRMIAALPADHPYKIYFHLYSDAVSDAGLADGFLHPCDRPFTAHGLRDFLARAGLEAAFFLHREEGQPRGKEPWDDLAVREQLGELDENFKLVARRKGDA